MYHQATGKDLAQYVLANSCSRVQILTQNRGESFGSSGVLGLFLLPRACENAGVSMCMCVKIEIGLRRCGTVVLGKEKDVIPNVSGAGYCNVLSWSLFSESRRALA